MALGQGKPVIVYVPKLVVSELSIDTEVLGKARRDQLEDQIREEGTDEDQDFDETMDTEALMGRLLSVRLERAAGSVLATAVRRHWADFDLYGEAKRIEAPDDRAQYRRWLDSVVRADDRSGAPGPSKGKGGKYLGRHIPALRAKSKNLPRGAPACAPGHPEFGRTERHLGRQVGRLVRKRHSRTSQE